MLRHLHVRNLAVLEEVSVEFGPGLNIVTGSTGAGKSLVVDSLALLAGARASSDLLRTGADRLVVAGVFAPGGSGWRAVLSEAGIECDDEELVVRRELNASGRGRVFLNDQPTTLRLLSQVSGSLLRIHGQREELGLTTPDLQRQWLDLEGGEAAVALLEECAAAYADLQQASERLARLTGDDRARHERLDLLRYQAQEIEGAGLVAGEEDDLRARRDRLRHAELIRESLANAAAALSESDDAACSQLHRASTALRPLRDIEPDAAAWMEELAELRVRADDLGSTLSARLAESEDDPGALDSIEDRLALLERLLRKYAPTSAEILELRERIEEELRELEGDDERLAALEQEVVRARSAYATKAAELSGRRAQWAPRLARKIERELAELALSKARFEIEVAFDTAAQREDAVQINGKALTPHAWGVDRVTYLFSPNPGEELRPLSRVASGGELARIYLALQVAAIGGGRRQREDLGLVFDEVDAGIGGGEAAVVGRKLRQLAEGGQVLAVTHLAQVAASGHLHFQVHKAEKGGRTGTLVRRLDAAARVEELARMLGGEAITDLTRSHAEELLQQAASSVPAVEKSDPSPSSAGATSPRKGRRKTSASTP